jgi:hypothetical protein
MGLLSQQGWQGATGPMAAPRRRLRGRRRMRRSAAVWLIARACVHAVRAQLRRRPGKGAQGSERCAIILL